MSVFPSRLLHSTCRRALHSKHRPDWLSLPRTNHSRTITAASSSPKSLSQPNKSVARGVKEDANAQKQLELSITNNLLQKTKVEEFLLDIASGGDQVTLHDIERYRPAKVPKTGSPRYENAYNRLLATLVRSFSFEQLREFGDLYQLQPPGKRNKWQLAAMIVEQAWNWPSLHMAKRVEKERTEIVYQSFPLDGREAFLLLGKDGANLLALSTKYNIHVSLSASPLSLKVEGLRRSINLLSQDIDHFKDNIQDELFALPSSQRISLDTLQRISRVSGIFLQDIGDGIIRLSHTISEESSVHVAKRLITFAIFEALRDVPAVVHSSKCQTQGPDAIYSLYPFFPAHPLPQITNIGNLFRARCVGQLAGPESYLENEGLVTSGRVLTLSGEEVALRDVLLTSIEDINPRSWDSTVIAASFGHLVAYPALSRHLSVALPLEGLHPLSRVLDWYRVEAGKRLFISSSSVAPLSSQTGSSLFYRLVFLPLPQCDEKPVNLLQNLTFEVAIIHPKVSSVTTTSQVNEVLSKDAGHIVLQPTCWAGSVNELDVMMPDRSMDIRFSVFGGSRLTENLWPESFKTYVSELRSHLAGAVEENKQPHPPLILSYQGINYGLETCTMVRRTWSTSTEEPSISTASENILDVGSYQRSFSYKVTCTNASMEAPWLSFLRLCDMSVSHHPGASVSWHR